MSAGGYPRQGGNTQQFGRMVDPRTGRLIIIVDDRKPRNTLSPRETFVRQQAARFGKLTTERALKKLLVPKHPILKLADMAQIGTSFYRMYREGVEELPLPRDPNNAQDMAVNFPASWAQYPSDESWYSGVSQRKYLLEPTRVLWHGSMQMDRFRTNSAGGEQVITNWKNNLGTKEVSVEEMVADRTATKREYWIGHRFDASKDFAGTTKGVLADTIVTKPNNPAQWPDWVNPPRTAPQPVQEPVWVILPDMPMVPRRRFDELPRQARHPYSEVGPVPVPNWMNDPRRLPSSPPDVVFRPVPVTSSPPRPGELEDVDIGPVPQPTPFRPDPRRLPPGPKVKERKVRIKHKGVLLVMGVIEMVPETLDAINALWKALPKSCKSGYFKLHGKGGKVFYKRRFRASQKQRMTDLYKCWTHMDMQTALEALVANQIEDKMYGKVGKLGGKLGNEAGLGRGIGFGSWDTFANDMSKASGQEMASFFPDFDAMVQFATRTVIPRGVQLVD